MGVARTRTVAAVHLLAVATAVGVGPRTTSRELTPPNSVTSDEANNMARRWTALGGQWWMQFIDGCFHSRGPNALEGNGTYNGHMEWWLDGAGEDGTFLPHLQTIYQRCASPRAAHSCPLSAVDLPTPLTASIPSPPPRTPTYRLRAGALE